MDNLNSVLSDIANKKQDWESVEDYDERVFIEKNIEELSKFQKIGFVVPMKELNTKMDNATQAKEKVAIRYIMRHVNKAYTEYIDAISVDEETRRGNMKNINMKMAA